MSKHFIYVYFSNKKIISGELSWVWIVAEESNGKEEMPAEITE